MQDAMELVQLASDWGDEYKVSVKVPDDVVMEDKWLARSALQKAVRRGELDEALSQAARLWRIDEDYCWRALGTIAVEDVGFGSPEAVLFSHLGQLKTFRASLDAGRLLTAVTAQMCHALKSRSCCEMSIAVEWGHRHHIMALSHYDRQELINLVLGSDPAEGFAALLVLKGKVPDGGLPRKKDTEAILEIEAEMMKLPEPFGLACVHAARRPVDSMSIAMFHTTRLFLKTNEAEECEVVEDVFPQSIRVGKFKSEAFDMHTQDGKRAIKALYTSLKKDYPELAQINATSAGKALGSAIFVEEGGLVDRRILGGELYDLQEAQDRTFLKTYGVPVHLYDKVRQIVRLEMPRLNQKRIWSWKL